MSLKLAKAEGVEAAIKFYRLSDFNKTAARAGLRAIRNLVNKGLFDDASRLAKSPGVLKPLAEDLSEYEGRTLLHRGRSPGHQIKPLGMGREQAVTLVADPQYGLAARKTHLGKGSITTPAQMDLKAALGRKMTDEGFEGAPKFYEAFKGPSGRDIHLTEFIHGTPAGDARNSAMDAFQNFANERGYNVSDMTSKGNVVTGPDGKGKVLDAIVSRAGMPDNAFHGRPTGAPKSHGEVMRDVFNPSIDELQQHDNRIENARRKVRR